MFEIDRLKDLHFAKLYSGKLNEGIFDCGWANIPAPRFDKKIGPQI